MFTLQALKKVGRGNLQTVSLDAGKVVNVQPRYARCAAASRARFMVGRID